MDIHLVLAKMFPGVDLCDLSPCTQSGVAYTALSRTWRHKTLTLPTEQAMLAVWAQILIEKPFLALPPAERRAKILEDAAIREYNRIKALADRNPVR